MTSYEADSGFLLRITLTKTSDPVVTRAIAIPADLTFEELHDTITAAFNWNDRDDPCTTWIFRVCHKDPSKISNVDNYSGALTAYFTKPGKGYETTPALLHTSTPVHEMFAPSNLSYGRFWTYNYGISRYHHAIEVEQASAVNAGRIRCMAGQGYISHKSWQFGDLRRAKDVTAQIKSTEDAHMESVHERLAVVQAAYALRKEDEAAEDVGPRPAKRPRVSQTRSVEAPIKSEEELLFLSEDEEEGGD